MAGKNQQYSRSLKWGASRQEDKGGDQSRPFCGSTMVGSKRSCEMSS